MKKRHDEWKEYTSKALPNSSALDTKEGPCAICLEETITNPVVLPCGHEFCFACVGKYQEYEACNCPKCREGNSNVAERACTASCPYCRGEIPNVSSKAYERMKIYRNRADVSSNGSEEQKKYARLALAEHKSFVEVRDFEDDDINMLYTRLFILSSAGLPEETITVAKQVLSLSDSHPNILDYDKLSQAQFFLAEAYDACGDLDNAREMYKAVVTGDVRRQMARPGVMISSARTIYESGKYDGAITIGNIAIELNRSLPGVHKYVALSQKAKGDIDGAKKTISRAILYEEHWDEDNLLQNKQHLRELNNL